VHDLGRDAAVFGALHPLQGVVDDGAVAVVEPGSTPPAVAVHGPFIAPSVDNPGLPRCAYRSASCSLSPAEFVQAVVVDAEVVGDLVDDGDGDLVDDLVLRLADIKQGIAINRDRVG
jgi:hypothetical protein